MTQEKKALTFKNHYLDILFKILDVPLPGPDSRARNKFVTILQKQIKLNETARLELLEKFADKDEKGKAKLKEGTNVYDIPEGKADEVNKEYVVMLNETFIIDILPSNKDSIDVVAKLVKETKSVFTLKEGTVYDKLCEEFEEITKKYLSQFV